MDESELRQVAAQVMAALDTILAGRPQRAAEVRAALTAALALPPGQAGPALAAALELDEQVRFWSALRLAPPPDAPLEVVFSDEELRGGGPATIVEPPPFAEWPGPIDPVGADNSAPAPPGAPPAGPPPTPPRPRVLQAQTLERVETGRPLDVRVVIAAAPAAGVPGGALKPFDVSAAGATLRVLLSAPDFTAAGDLQADVLVPADGDSDPHLFMLTAGRVGLHTITVEAYRAGTYLGVVRLQVSVEHSTRPVEGPVRVAEMSSVAFEPGEVTLTVERSSEGYRFQLLGTTLYEPVTAVMGDPTVAVTQLATELRAMAIKRSDFADPALVRRRLRNLGVALWGAAVPERVQEQFWEQADRITMFTIAAANDAIPFELLYPLNGSHDLGFLVERFPVVRRAYARQRALRLPVGSAGYVVPPGSPTNAMDEVAAIAQLLGSRVTDRGVESRLDRVADLLLDCPGILHFACHNAFTDADGSSILLDGGPWRPTDLSVAVQQVALADACPLVFLNACRSAGEADWFSQMTGWARQFVAAGAGAFLGSLWAVRSSSALTFAEAFYREFVTAGRTLGQAALLARQAIAGDDGDPTWLAYSVYGNPAAVVAPPTP